jgi:hypothetical protein
MKRIALILVSTLFLTACATGHDAYYAAVLEREKRQAEMELRADTAIAQMAISGDAGAKEIAIIYFATRAHQAGQSEKEIKPPKSIFPWLNN